MNKILNTHILEKGYEIRKLMDLVIDSKPYKVPSKFCKTFHCGGDGIYQLKMPKFRAKPIKMPKRLQKVEVNSDLPNGTLGTFFKTTS